MPGSTGVRTPTLCKHPLHDDLLLRETNHRCSNDLQLVVSLLAIQSRRSANAEVRHALDDAMDRVLVLARARTALHSDRQPTLETALRLVCEALHAQAEPRSILVSFQSADQVDGLSAAQITTLALVANELATNAIKHGYKEVVSGHIGITAGKTHTGDIIVLVTDDGLPFPDAAELGGKGLGLSLAKRLMASIGGLFIQPQHGSKTFELRVPAAAG
jgi:two-component sensor histidine kinase